MDKRTHYLPLNRDGERARACIGIAAFILLAAISARSQTPSGSIDGLVLDPSGAAVSGCQINGMNISGIVESRTSSGPDGKFHVLLSPGVKKVQVSCQGFAIMQRNYGTLQDTRLTAVFRARIADVKQTITVGAEMRELSLDQSSTQESQMLTGEAIGELPVVDEDYVTFMSRFLDPSVTGAQGTSLVVNGVEGGNFYQAPSAIKSLEVNQEQDRKSVV